MRNKRRVYWNNEKIIIQLKARKETAAPLRRYLVSKSDPRLVAAATKYFGNWSNALRAAGIEPRLVIPLRKWNRDSVIAEILLRHERGMPLNSYAVQVLRQGIYAAACRRFGSWAKALQASGIDPTKVARQRSDWTKKSIIEAIVQYRESGKPLNAGSIKPSSLQQSAYRLFGSWDAALAASGIDPRKTRQREIWTNSRVTAEICRRFKEGKALHAAAVAREWCGLLGMAIVKFGSWNSALRMAGLNPDTVRKALPTWTRSRIIEHIRRYRDERKSLLPGHIRPVSIRPAANRLFGSWKAALRAAGLCVEHIYRNKISWTRSRILMTICAGLSDKRYLKDWDVPLSSLRFASKRMFGSWHAAIQAAGFDPTAVLKRGPRPKSHRCDFPKQPQLQSNLNP